MKKELLISFTGHLAIIGLAGFITSTYYHRQKPLPRPSTITVQLFRGEPQEPPQPVTKPHLVQPAPKPAPVEKPKEEKPKSQPAPAKKTQEPAPKKQEAMFKHAGLGAKVEGVQALGYNYYLQQMLERIAENWQDPQTRKAGKLSATVMFTIERNGALTEIKLEKSSGDRLFDEICLRAVMVTAKLPPLPAEFRAPRLKIHLEFER